jgi:hypothetical protein
MVTAKQSLVTTLAFAMALTAGCASPTEPAPSGTPRSLDLGHCEYLDSTANCPVYAVYDRPVVEVTQHAEWVSVTPRVVRIRSRGTLQRLEPGRAEIRVSFNGKTASFTFLVLANGPPWKTLPFRTLVNVRDQNGQPLEGVLVEITAGAMSGGSRTTDSRGSAAVWEEFICGPATLRLSKAGYRTLTRSLLNCGTGGDGSWGSEALDQPITMMRN